MMSRLLVCAALLGFAHGLQIGPLDGLRRAKLALTHRPVSPLLAATTSAEEGDGTRLAQKWTERINKVSTFASILCAIDCTVLPILLLLLPVAGSSAMLHKIAHAMSLYFVLPVGGAAVTANLAQHRKPLLGLWGASGLLLIALANVHLPHGIISHSMEEMLHSSHELINVGGCGLLLSSQWVSHKVLHVMGKDCGHDHGGSKKSSCGHDHNH